MIAMALRDLTCVVSRFPLRIASRVARCRWLPPIWRTDATQSSPVNWVKSSSIECRVGGYLWTSVWEAFPLIAMAHLVRQPTLKRNDAIAAIDSFLSAAIGSAILVSLASIFPGEAIELARMNVRRDRSRPDSIQSSVNGKDGSLHDGNP